jgi:hypothetical protein
MKEGFYDNGIMRVDDKNGFLEKLDNNLSLLNMETIKVKYTTSLQYQIWY